MSEENNKYPQISDIEKELNRERYRQKYKLSLKNTVFSLVTVAAIAVLVATLWLPVLQIYGGSMSPTLEDGQIVVSTTVNKLESGDIIAFYYNNKILVRRAICMGGDEIAMDQAGNVYIESDLLDEPYLDTPSIGQCNLTFPYRVPENHIFVMGDHRAIAMDSRLKEIGTVPADRIIGKVLFTI